MSTTRRTVPRLLMRVWDVPSRLFLWATAVLLAAAAAGAWGGQPSLHVLSGYGLLVLLLFRLAWGVVGSETARLRPLLRGPEALDEPLAGLRARGPDDEIGHGVLGGWWLLVFLALLAVVLGAGSLSGGAGLAGPLAPRIGPEAAAGAASWHTVAAWLLAAWVALRVATLVVATVQGRDVLRPLFTGKKRLPANLRQPRAANPWRAAVVLLASAALVWAFAALA